VSIDPTNITDYNRSDAELEEFMLFCIAAAGKNSQTQARALKRFFIWKSPSDSPFEFIKSLERQHQLSSELRNSRLGKYNLLYSAFNEVSHAELRRSTPADLEKITGIGPKTARMFILHSRPYQQYAVLDTHVLKWLGKNLGIKVPKNSPSGVRYKELEDLFIEVAGYRQVTCADLDLQIWNEAQK